jgi:general secretion pathway protein I
MRRAEAGFTLLELLVALAVFSLAVAALLNLAGENTRAAALVEERVLAAIVAENRAVELLTGPAPPAEGRTSGQEEAGERVWLWTTTVAATEDPEILRIEVAVRPEGLDRTVGEVTAFRTRR